MAEQIWAVFHDGEYHRDKIIFDPAVDRILYKAGDDLESLVARYDDPKASLVRGAFICPQRSINNLCGDKPASQDWQGEKAARQNAHRLQSLASGSHDHLGVLPGVPGINRPSGQCDKMRVVAENVEAFQRSRKSKKQ